MSKKFYFRRIFFLSKFCISVLNPKHAWFSSPVVINESLLFDSRKLSATKNLMHMPTSLCSKGTQAVRTIDRNQYSLQLKLVWCCFRQTLLFIGQPKDILFSFFSDKLVTYIKAGVGITSMYSLLPTYHHHRKSEAI